MPGGAKRLGGDANRHTVHTRVLKEGCKYFLSILETPCRLDDGQAMDATRAGIFCRHKQLTEGCSAAPSLLVAWIAIRDRWGLRIQSFNPCGEPAVPCVLECIVVHANGLLAPIRHET